MIFIDICILVSVRVYKEVLSESARKGINICELAQHGFIYKAIHDTSSTAQGSGGSFKNQETYRRDWLLWITDGRANPLMDRQVVGVVFSEVAAMVAVVTSPQQLDVA